MNHYQKTFNIDSGNRSSGTNTDFYSNMNMPNIKTDPYDRCAIVNCEIPKAYYMLDETTTNSIVFNLNGAGDENIGITIDRNYTAVQLATTLQDALIAQYGAGFSVDFSSSTNHFIISHASLAFTVDFLDAALLAKYFGFNHSGPIASLTNAIESVFYVNLQRYDCLVIKSSLALNNNNDELAFIYPVSSADGNMIIFNPQNPNFTAVECRDSNSSQNRFSLVDFATNIPINLNGSEWRMLLTLWKDKS